MYTLSELEDTRPDLYIGDIAGEDGNAYWILAKVAKRLQDLGVSEDVAAKIRKEMTSGDYIFLLMTVDKYFTVLIKTTEGPVFCEAAVAGAIVYGRASGEYDEFTTEDSL